MAQFQQRTGSTGWKGWRQRSWCQPQNTCCPTRSAAAWRWGFYSQLGSCRVPESAQWHSVRPRGDTELCWLAVFWPLGELRWSPTGGPTARGTRRDVQLTLEVAVVVQVAVHEAVVGLRDSLGRTVPSGPARSQGWQPPVLLPPPLAAPNLGSRVPQEPHGFERSSTLSCPLLPFPDAVARRPLAVGKDGAVPEWIWERSQRNSVLHCALMDTGATAGPSQSPYCR